MHQRDYSLLGKETISSVVKDYPNSNKVPSKLSCAYTQNTLCLYPKHLAPIPETERCDFQRLTNTFSGARSVAPL